LDGLSPQKRGPKVDPQAIENAKLRREMEKLKEQLRKAELIIDIQKKVSQILGVKLPDNPLDEQE
jgi:transposase